MAIRDCLPWTFWGLCDKLVLLTCVLVAVPSWHVGVEHPKMLAGGASLHGGCKCSLAACPMGCTATTLWGYVCIWACSAGMAILLCHNMVVCCQQGGLDVGLGLSKQAFMQHAAAH